MLRIFPTWADADVTSVAATPIARMHWHTTPLSLMDYLLGTRRDVGVPTFEGPEFQPNVIFMKIVGEKAQPERRRLRIGGHTLRITCEAASIHRCRQRAGAVN